MDIKEQARQLIYQSPVTNYFNKETIEKKLENIYVMTNESKFNEKYVEATGEKFDGNLEGFQNSSGIYIGPKATPHTIIHELLHELSSKFDENNHRIQNGIQGNMHISNFGIYINEGITDYLAAKISQEKSRHYIQGHKLFSSIENSMIDYFENEEILYSIYFNNENILFNDFLNKTAGKGAGKTLYEKFLFMNDEALSKFIQKVNSGVKKRVIFRNIKKSLDKFKNFVLNKKTLSLPESKKEDEKKSEWLNGIKYNVEQQSEIINNNEVERNTFDKNKDDEGR